MTTATIIETEKIIHIAQQVSELLKPHVDKIEIVGGIRRQWSQNKRIDIVIQSNDDIKLFNINMMVVNYFWPVSTDEFGPYLLSFVIDNIPLKIYITRNPQEFEVMKLVKTGDNAFIRLLSMRAKQKGLILKHSHSEKLFGLYGLYKTLDRKTRKFVTVLNPKRIEARTEQDIIKRVFFGSEENEMEHYLNPVNRSINEAVEESVE